MPENQIDDKLLHDRATLPLSRFLFQSLLPFFGGLRIAGAENVPPSGPVLFCPNHTSDLDPVVVLAATVRNDLNAMGKSELFEIPVLGWYFRAIGAMPVKRDSADRAALRQAENVLRAGRMLLMFPEGRCSESGLLQPLQSGATLLSQRCRAPIIPIGIRGTRNILPYGKVVPQFAGGGVCVTFGKPLSPDSYKDLPHKQKLTFMSSDLRAELARLTFQP